MSQSNTQKFKQKRYNLGSGTKSFFQMIKLFYSTAKSTIYEWTIPKGGRNDLILNYIEWVRNL